MHTNNGEAFLAVAIIPTFDEGQRVTTVVAAESPELDQHDASAQILELQRFEFIHSPVAKSGAAADSELLNSALLPKGLNNTFVKPVA